MDNPEHTPVYNPLAEALKSMPAALVKDQEKIHGAKYNYVSIDSMLEKLRPHLAKHGLSPHITEVSEMTIFEMGLDKNGDPQPWVRCTYGFAITDSPIMPDISRMERKTHMVPMYDDKACAHLSSYAFKFWLRAKCMIATGEKDEVEEINYESALESGKSKEGKWSLHDALIREQGVWKTPNQRIVELMVFLGPLFPLKGGEPKLMNLILDTNQTLFKDVWPTKSGKKFRKRLVLLKLMEDDTPEVQEEQQQQDELQMDQG